MGGDTLFLSLSRLFLYLCHHYFICVLYRHLLPVCHVFLLPHPSPLALLFSLPN